METARDRAEMSDSGSQEAPKTRIPRPTVGNKVTVVLGAQWGDEGKGKVVDLLAQDADMVCRCQVSSVVRRESAGNCCPLAETPASLMFCRILYENLLSASDFQPLSGSCHATEILRESCKYKCARTRQQYIQLLLYSTSVSCRASPVLSRTTNTQHNRCDFTNFTPRESG